MVNLLSAGFWRLGKSRLFGCALAFSAGLGVLIALNYHQMNQYERIPLDGAFFTYPILAALITAVFIPLFFGVEYSGHTIRNKITAGHSRMAIYTANLTVGTAASLLFCTAYMAAVIVVGVPLIGPVAIDAALAVRLIAGSWVTMAAFAALFTLAVMTCGRKSLSSVVCVLGVFLLLFAGIYMRSRLEAPEYLNGWMANPQYLSGPRRAVFEFLYNMLPSSQAVQYSSQQAQNLNTMPLYALALIVLSAGLGIALFQRKDLK